MGRQLLVLSACFLLVLGNAFAFTENNVDEAKSIVATEVTANARLVQTCGGSADVSLSENGYTLYVNFGSNSFRIDWNDGTRQYYSAGTTEITILTDRFSISVPGESSSSVQTYCFKIER